MLLLEIHIPLPPHGHPLPLLHFKRGNQTAVQLLDGGRWERGGGGTGGTQAWRFFQSGDPYISPREELSTLVGSHESGERGQRIKSVSIRKYIL